MDDGLINVCIKVGGDPTYGQWIGLYNFRVPPNTLAELKALFPKLTLFCSSSSFRKLTSLACGLCGALLPSFEYLDKSLTRTHIYSALELQTGEVILLDRECAIVIKEFFEGQGYTDPVLA